MTHLHEDIAHMHMGHQRWSIRTIPSYISYFIFFLHRYISNNNCNINMCSSVIYIYVCMFFMYIRFGEGKLYNFICQSKKAKNECNKTRLKYCCTCARFQLFYQLSRFAFKRKNPTKPVKESNVQEPYPQDFIYAKLWESGTIA